MSYDAATLQYYSGEVRRVAEADHDSWLGPYLDRFLALLPPGGQVLELGCGAGQDAAAMTARGLAVDATDGCPEMAREAARRLGQPVRVMRFDELEASAAYDGVWASASLLHVPRTELAAVLARVHRALKPAGALYASFKTGRPEGRDKFGRYFNYPSEEELRRFLDEAGGWRRIDVLRSSGVGYDQLMTEWLHCFASRG
jgi:SAM-dependent methyltransferase